MLSSAAPQVTVASIALAAGCLMAAKRIGKADSWEWFPAGTCTPAVGCTRSYAEHWQPTR